MAELYAENYGHELTSVAITHPIGGVSCADGPPTHPQDYDVDKTDYQVEKTDFELSSRGGAN